MPSRPIAAVTDARSASSWLTVSVRPIKLKSRAFTPGMPSSALRSKPSSVGQSIFSMRYTAWPCGPVSLPRSMLAFMPTSLSALRIGAGSGRWCRTSSRRPIKSKSSRSMPSTAPRRLRIVASSVGQSMLEMKKRVASPVAGAATGDATSLMASPSAAAGTPSTGFSTGFMPRLSMVRAIGAVSVSEWVTVRVWAFRSKSTARTPASGSSAARNWRSSLGQSISWMK